MKTLEEIYKLAIPALHAYVEEFKARPTRVPDTKEMELIGREAFHLERAEFEAMAKDSEEEKLLHWFFTRFIHNKRSYAHGRY